MNEVRFDLEALADEKNAILTEMVMVAVLNQLGVRYDHTEVSHDCRVVTARLSKRGCGEECVDEAWCGRCERDTMQKICYGDHERDSSGNSQTCTACGWHRGGVKGEWYPPNNIA